MAVGETAKVATLVLGGGSSGPAASGAAEGACWVLVESVRRRQHGQRLPYLYYSVLFCSADPLRCPFASPRRRRPAAALPCSCLRERRPPLHPSRPSLGPSPAPAPAPAPTPTPAPPPSPQKAHHAAYLSTQGQRQSQCPERSAPTLPTLRPSLTRAPEGESQRRAASAPETRLLNLASSQQGPGCTAPAKSSAGTTFP